MLCLPAHHCIETISTLSPGEPPHLYKMNPSGLVKNVAPRSLPPLSLHKHAVTFPTSVHPLLHQLLSHPFTPCYITSQMPLILLYCLIHTIQSHIPLHITALAKVTRDYYVATSVMITSVLVLMIHQQYLNQLITPSSLMSLVHVAFILAYACGSPSSVLLLFSILLHCFFLFSFNSACKSDSVLDILYFSIYSYFTLLILSSPVPWH